MFAANARADHRRAALSFSPPTQPDRRRSEEKAMEKINLALTEGPAILEWEHWPLIGPHSGPR